MQRALHNGREVLAAPVQHASAVGAAIYAAAGTAGGGGTERIVYRPLRAEQRVYESLYQDYLHLARYWEKVARR